jgi:hypothetical protein
MSTYCQSQNEQPAHRECVVLIEQTLRAKVVDDRRILSSETVAAEQLSQRPLLNPR